MEQELLLAESPRGPEAPPGKYLMLLPTLLLTGHLPLATGPAQSSPRRDLHRAGEHMEQLVGQGECCWSPEGA